MPCFNWSGYCRMTMDDKCTKCNYYHEEQYCKNWDGKECAINSPQDFCTKCFASDPI